MRAHSNSALEIGSQFTDAVQGWNGRYGPAPEVHDSAVILANLAQEHRDLNDVIEVLSEYVPTDDSLISRLKKRKLHIKDQMTHIAGMPPLFR